MIHQNVSIVMCTYNGERFLKEQLDSIINQSYPIYELIIQDDRSTDDTLNIVKEYASRYPFFKVFVNEQNLGYNRNFLSALLKATGDAIAIADQDDIWDKEKIQKQINKLNEGYSLVFHNSFLFEDNPSFIQSKRHNAAPVISELRLIMKPFIPGHECLFTSKALPLIKKLYTQENSLAYAYIIAVACITLGNINYLDEGLVYWRRHEDAATNKVKKKTKNAFVGIIESLSSLFDNRKKEIPVRYFNAISILDFKDPTCSKVITLMQGNTFNILKVCVICGRNVSSFFSKSTIRNLIKATFTPLHLIREGRFLIK